MGGGVTFGPKETAQTIAYHQIRKKIDQDEVREDLLQQMHKEKNNQYVNLQKSVNMEKTNVAQAQSQVKEQLQEEYTNRKHQK